MTGWTANDESIHVYTFPYFILGGSSLVTIYSGFESDTDTDLYWGRTYDEIWNNDGDTLFLNDTEGFVVVLFNYPPP